MESKSEQKSATKPTETTHSTVRTISILTIDFFLLGYTARPGSHILWLIFILERLLWKME